MKVAIIHDWLVGGGAERVVVELHKLYPDAPIYTSYCSPRWRKELAGAEIVTSYLQYWPFSVLRKFVPFLRVWWFSSLRLDGYDLVISSSGAEAKGIKTNKPTVHINYCHAPIHYYWSRYDEYLKSPGFGVFNPLARLGLRLLVGPLRRWDKKAAQRPDFMIANSTHIKNEIKKYYDRVAVVIHPPVDVERFAIRDLRIENQKRAGFVTAGRQTPYKRIDLAVAACNQLDLSLNVISSGPEHRRLRKMAGPTINFLGELKREEVPKYFQHAEAFILPNLDDFGIVAVEALAAGTPVIAFRAGGALDYVDKTTGLFFDDQTPESLGKVLADFPKHQFNHAAIARCAQEFSAANFRAKMTNYIKSKTK